MAKKKIDVPAEGRIKIKPMKLPVKPDLLAFVGYFLTASALTFPLVLRLNSSVYGFYDHISTDLFANIHFYFWMLKHSIVEMKTSPLVTDLFAAPYGSRMNFVNFTGFIQLPITVIFGHIFSRNFTIMFNLIVSGLGMYYLVKHITKSASAAFIAGIVYAFCPNMMVRAYTTFDSTQVHWIPFYTLFVIRFIEDRSWKNALLSGLFLICNILFAMPYFLLFLPVHTVALLFVYAAWRIWGENRGFGGLVKDLSSPDALRGWMKITVAFVAVLAVFFAYYQGIVGGNEFSSSIQRTTDDLSQLSLKPTDYLMPHPRSMLLKGNIKDSYWNTMRPGKDPDSFVAYIGYIALALAALGYVTGKKKVYRWLFLGGAAIAFWSTMGPSLFGLPTPSGMIYHLYAPFARRILLYKVFVQMSIAGLAGLGAAYLFERKQFAAFWPKAGLLTGIVFAMILEYSLVPPVLSVDLRSTPEIYDHVKELPDDSILFELPHKKYSGNMFQGYVYYQAHHGKRLFNPILNVTLIPDHVKPFYKNMEVPVEAQSYANLAALRYLGVTHLTYHWMIGTRTVGWPYMVAPGYLDETVAGVRKVFSSDKNPQTDIFDGPYDYTFADLYEITAEPSPVALVFDYHDPYEAVPGLLKGDGRLEFGWASALLDTTCTFYFPIAERSELVRILRQGGKVTAVNLSDDPIDFSVSFIASSADSGRVL